jgi:hypothetical protein
MERLEKEFAVRTKKLEVVMNFTAGATSNMQMDDENAESEEEINNPPKQNQAVADGKKEKEKEELVYREVKTKPAIA